MFRGEFLDGYIGECPFTCEAILTPNVNPPSSIFSNLKWQPRIGKSSESNS
jgi:hypothetical protein